jgi:hypothetical protein
VSAEAAIPIRTPVEVVQEFSPDPDAGRPPDDEHPCWYKNIKAAVLEIAAITGPVVLFCRSSLCFLTPSTSYVGRPAAQ